MAIDILLPQLGLTMTEGLILEWKKKEGDTVKKGELLFLVENDKAVLEVEAQADGVLARILVEPMETVPVGTRVGLIAAPGEAIEAIPSAEAAPEEAIQEETPPEAETPAKSPQAPAPAMAADAAEDPSPAAPEAVAGSPEDFVSASPLARLRAQEAGLDLAAIRGSGPEGAVVARDLPPRPGPAVSPGAEGPDAYEDISLSRIGVISAQRLSQSWTEIPQFTLYAEAFAGAILELRNYYKTRGSSVSLTVILAKILAHSLVKYPRLNAQWLGEGKVRCYRKINVGIAMDTPEGLVVPVLRDCADRGYRSLAEEMGVLAERGRNRSLRGEDFSGGTVSLSNLGMFGISRFRAIVNPPQTSIISVGAIRQKFQETPEGPEYADFIEVGLTADHRAVDGAYAARFLQDFTAGIANPALIGD